MITEIQRITEVRVQEKYNQVNIYIREDLFAALTWAHDTLRNEEGAGHLFEILAEDKDSLVCCFSKPSWAGDHCGRIMETASQAVVMAVCEYLCGM